MDHSHAPAVILIATTLVILPVLLLSAVLVAFDVFPFQWIVDAVIVVRVVHDFAPIECWPMLRAMIQHSLISARP